MERLNSYNPGARTGPLCLCAPTVTGDISKICIKPAVLLLLKLKSILQLPLLVLSVLFKWPIFSEITPSVRPVPLKVYQSQTFWNSWYKIFSPDAFLSSTNSATALTEETKNRVKFRRIVCNFGSAENTHFYLHLLRLHSLVVSLCRRQRRFLRLLW